MPPPGVDGLVVLHPYRAEIRSLVLAAKNGGCRPLLRVWGRWLGERASPGFDAVTWVPASRRGRRRRGYDQGRDLARAAATTSGVPAPRLLVRRPGPDRTGAGRDQRLQGPSVRCPIAPPPRILLVDDVMTTGASIAAAAAALRRAGAGSVTAAVVAAAGTNRDLCPQDHERQMN